MQGKSIVSGAKNVRPSGGKAVEKRWPGGRCDGRILRFAEADTVSASAISATGFNTAEPAGGAGRIQPLRAFRRAKMSKLDIGTIKNETAASDLPPEGLGEC